MTMRWFRLFSCFSFFFRLSGNFPSQFCILFIWFPLLPSTISRLCRLLVVAVAVSSPAEHIYIVVIVSLFVLLYYIVHTAHIVTKVCRLTICLTLSYSGSSSRQMWVPQEWQLINEWMVWLDNNNNFIQNGIKIEYVLWTRLFIIIQYNRCVWWSAAVVRIGLALVGCECERVRPSLLYHFDCLRVNEIQYEYCIFSFSRTRPSKILLKWLSVAHVAYQESRATRIPRRKVKRENDVIWIELAKIQFSRIENVLQVTCYWQICRNTTHSTIFCELFLSSTASAPSSTVFYFSVTSHYFLWPIFRAFLQHLFS